MQDELHGVFDVLLSRGIPISVLKLACSAAVGEQISPEEYLVRHGLVTKESLYSAFAELCGVPFLPDNSFRFRTLNERPLTLGEQGTGPTILSLHRSRPLFAVAPEFSQFEAVHLHLERYPDFAQTIRIATPEGIVRATSRSNSPATELENRFPFFSARHVRGPLASVAAVGGAATGCLLMWLSLPEIVFGLAATVAVACPFVGGVRLISAMSSMSDPLTYELPEAVRSGPIDWPNYSVLVPLYHEAGVLGDLIHALKQLNYPPTKLKIVLLIESDDPETLSAIPEDLPVHFEVFVVPEGQPKTKPRALSYGLAATTSEYLTIFDAEDRPHPDQLKTAALFFALGPPSLACLQARLAIDNADECFLSRHFALEYACLFDQMLPWLFRQSWPLPLGGTSNHFRTSALHAVAGWDSYNVTEDADLGIRLERLGYQVGMLPSQTLEEAPVTLQTWLGQRARWHKGWLQTVIVHFQSPAKLTRDLGLVRTLVLTALFIGTFAFVALHPISIAVLLAFAADVLAAPVVRPEAIRWAMLFGFLGAIGYVGSLAALWMGAYRRSYGIHLSDILGIWLYWLLASMAFYRALWEFARAPHAWNKTEHGLSRRRAGVREPGGKQGS